MPLQDHFRPPLSLRRHWHAFHNAWATYISSELNQRLPPGYFAEANVQFGIEIDVASFEEPGPPSIGGAPQTGTWTPPKPALSIPISLITDAVEVLVFQSEGGPTLAGAIELLSPANRDRPAHRAAFVAKCVFYLQQAVGVVVVDVVTSRLANLHAELLTQLTSASPTQPDADLYVAAYRPVERDGQSNLDVWHEALEVGRSLPTMPLWLRGDLCLPIELESTYDRTCREQRVSLNGV
ncbi:MAG: DUF4058 family protein [Gemmataceae bacterium]|nr:DUF4058 family protein [Gemmataceae bacterium]